jgi:hypothetical protein
LSAALISQFLTYPDGYNDGCDALAAQDKIYPLNDAIEVMDNLMTLDTKSSSLDDAREYIKALALSSEASDTF